MKSEPSPRAEEQAAEQEHLFLEAMAKSTPGILYVYNARGEFLRWNSNFESVSGYSSDEIKGMHPREFFAEEDRPQLETRIAEVFEKGASSLEAAFVAKDGTATPYFFTGRRGVFEGMTCLVGMGIDISEFKQAQTAVEESERRHRTTLDNILEGCQIIGFDWRYIYLNEAASVQNKRPNAELIGKTMQECWPGIEFTDSFALLKRSMEERISLSREVEFEFPDGSVGWFDLRGHPVPEGLFILSVDVTERHLALQKLEDKTIELEAANRALRQEAKARGMNGRRLADEARALYPNLAVLFTSGYTENAMADRDGRVPGMQLLSKPYRRQDLAAKVRAALDFARR